MRSSNIELLRIVAMFLIVVHHIGVQTAWPDMANDPALSSAVNILAFGGKIGVDIFVLITGYFMVKSRFKARSFFRTVTETWFYSWLFLAIFLVFSDRDISKASIFESICPIFTGEYWFITTYLALYLFIPLLNRVMLSMSRRSQRLVLALGFVVFSLAPTVLMYDPLNENLPWFFFVYLLGGYIRLSVDGDEKLPTGASSSFGEKLLCVLNPADLLSRHSLLWALASCAFILSSVVFITYANILDGFDFIWWAHFFMQSAVPALFVAVGFFYVFSRLPLPYVKSINMFGAATFGVYLIHEQQFVRAWLWEKALFLVDFGPIGLLLGAVVLCAAVYLACSIADMLRKRFVEDPFMRRVEERFGAVFDRIDAAMRFE